MASPWDVDLSDPWSVDLSTGDDADWETRGIVQINRKTGKTRPLAQLAGAKPGVGKVDIPDPGLLRLTLEGASSAFGRAMLGTFERQYGASPVFEQGKRDLAAGYADTREQYLTAHPSGIAPVAAAASEVGTSLLPLIPGGALGAAGKALAAPIGTGSALARAATGAVQNLPTAAAYGLATSDATAPLGQQLREIAPQILLGTGLGAAGGVLSGRPKVAQEPAGAAPRPVDPEFAAMADASLKIGTEKPITPAGPLKVVDAGSQGPVRNLQALDEAGNVVGEMRLTVGDDGFHVNEVTTTGKGTGAGRALYQAAADEHGPYLGSLAQTAEGEGFVNRLRETDPQIFGDDPGSNLRPSESLADEKPLSTYHDYVDAAGTGNPGLTVETTSGKTRSSEISDLEELGWVSEEYLDPNVTNKQAVYRDPSGNPVALVSIRSTDRGQTWKTEHLYAKKTGTLWDRRPAKAIQDFIREHGAWTSTGEITSAAASARDSMLGESSTPQGRLTPAARAGGGGAPPPPSGRIPPPFNPDRAAPADLPDFGDGLPPFTGAKNTVRAGAVPADEFQYNVDRLGVHDALKPELNRILHEELKGKLPTYGGGQIEGLGAKLADPEVIKSLALKTGLTPEELVKRRPGWVLDTTGAALLDASLTGKTTKLEGLVRDVAGGKVPPAELADAQARIAQLRYERNTLLLASSGAASEQGRALGARRFTVPGLSPEDSLRIAIQRKYQMTQEQIDGLAKLDTSRPEDVNAFLRGIDRPDLRNMVTSLWRASIMSGIPTQIRNILGNTTQLAWEMGVRPLTGAIEEGGLAKLHGRAPNARVRDVVPAFVGAYDGSKAGFGKALAVLKTGMTQDTAGKLNLGRMNSFELVQNPILRNLGKAATEPVYRTLSAVDTFFRTVGWTSKQYETAARLASQEGKPLAEMMTDPRVLQEAESFARRITYTDEPSKIAKGFKKVAEGVDDFTGIPLGTFAIPFTSVPDRVMARAFEATPAGLMRAAWRAARKDPAAADGLAKGALGTAVAYWAYDRAKDGLCTAGVPQDAAERSQFYALGAQPWSCKVGDKWVPYSQLGPLGFTMAMSAQVAEYNAGAKDDEGVPHHLLRVGLAAADYVLDQSYVDNAQKLAETIGSRSDPEARVKALEKFARQSAAGFVPYSALQRNIAQAMDPRVTDPKTLGQTIEANTPFLSKDVPGKLSPWGEEITRQESPLGAFLPRNTPLIALAQKEPKLDPIEAEMARIGVAVPFVGKQVGSDKRGTKRPLSEDEWRALQVDTGQALKTRLSALIASPAYQALGDSQKANLVQRYIELERKRSRIKLYGT